jgi:ornithine carbamoyltransferase
MKHYGKGHEAMELLAERGRIPVINGLDDKEHPCQVMGDIFTIKENFGSDYKKKKIVFTWGYAQRQKSPGVPHSMMAAASILGMNILFSHPRGFELDREYIDFAGKAVKLSGGKLEFCHNLMEAVEGADVIYVKSWKSLSMSGEEDEKSRNRLRNDWCVTEEHFKRANPGAVFMNCLPIIRGEQAAPEVIDGPHSIIYDEAENRLHIQKAIMAALIG